MESFIRRTWDEYNLSADAALDKHALEDAAEIQASLMDKWLDLLAQAQDTLTDAKNRLAETEAKLQLDARKGACSEYGKLTEATVKAWITLHPDYKADLKAKTKAEGDVAYLQHAKTVLEHKKSMIQIEGQLWICGYFARPHGIGGLKEQVDNTAREHTANILKDSFKKRGLSSKRGAVFTED